MSKVKKVIQQTNNHYLNLYEAEAIHRDGAASSYYVASRAKTIDDLMITTGINQPDGVAIFGIYGEKKYKIALVRQFRYPLNDYVYEFPAGLMEKGEDITDTAIREMYEETGLYLKPIDCQDFYKKPFFTTVGMTDESCAMVYGYLEGTPTNKNQELSEDIEIIQRNYENQIREEQIKQKNI